MAHSHSHGAETSSRGRLAIAAAITVSIVIAQLVGAWLTGSLALLTDAVHSAADSLGLIVALVAASLMLRAATANKTWGWRRVELIAALIQGALLLGIGVFAAVEGFSRLGLWGESHAPEIPGGLLLIFGAVGLVGNVISLSILAGGRKSNLNMRAAFLEVGADALGSLGVIVAAIVLITTGWPHADTVAALVIAALIIPRALVLLRDSLQVLLDFAPKGLDVEEIRKHLLQLEHVREVHDLHVSTVATGLPVLTAHVVVDDECFQEGCAVETLAQLRTCVAEHFEVSVEHSTFQLEPASHAQQENHLPH